VANVYENLIPRTMSREILSVAGQQSAVLSLGRRLVMPTGLMSIPIVSFMPVAGWVNPRYGGRKPATKVEWTAQAVQAEECACVLALPNSYIDDAGYPVWEQVRTLVAGAIAEAIDAAVLFGQSAPAAFPAGGIAGLAGAAATGADAITAIDAAAVAVETSGGVPNGIAASTKIGGALRAAYRTANALPDQAPASQIYGWPVTVVREWDSTKGDALVGDWNDLLVGVREDITFDMSSEAILQDNTGAIIANSFQDDLTALRCYIRLGVAIGQPLDPGTDAPVAPFEFADWTTP
jgi:HK97 family phage major capsid protein